MSAARGSLRAVPSRPDRAVAYIRVSKERDGMISPELQLASIEQHCERMGYEIVETISDLDLTGRFWKRRQVERAIGLIEAGQADVLVVWKVSRVSRNRKDWAIAVDRVEVVGGRMESATEPMDTTTSSGRFARGMLAELAAFESERMGEQWKETLSRRRALGLPHSGKPRVGYKYSRENGYEIDPAQAPVIVTAHRMYVDGSGFDRIRHYLFDNGIESRRPAGRPMSAVGVQMWMDGGFSAGLLHTPQEAQKYAPGAHQPILDEAAWSAYREARQARRTSLRGFKGDNLSHSLSGIVTCGGCGKSAVCWNDHSIKGAPKLFVCRALKGSPCEARGRARADRVESEVLSWLQDISGHLDAWARHNPEAATPRGNKDVLLRRQLDTQAAIDRLTDGYVRGIVPESAYAVSIKKLTSEAAAQAAESAVSQRPDITERVTAMSAELLRDWSLLTLLERNTILREIVRVRLVRVGAGQHEVLFSGAWE
ncbi:recombinase family protein [Arthrobacter sp. MP_2.3]|uniref:recombinase family protein n=1 Tax=Arthrobacter sp. MP_2.3 TaxID=3349633 RepID=UPI0038D4705D